MLKLTNHNSYPTSFIKAIQFIILKVILIQACCPLLKSRKTSRPTTFSPNISLRQKSLAQARRTLAQASSLCLGESSTSSIGTLHAFSLARPSSPKRDIRSLKKYSGSPGRPFMEKYLGEPLLILPRRDMPAWVSLTVIATIFSCSRQYDIPNSDPTILYIHDNTQHANQSQDQHQTTTNISDI